MVIDREFWSGRRVVVTGHTGFKGGWLSLWLFELGAKVFGIALPPSGERNLFSSAGIERYVDGELADIREMDLSRAFKEIQPDVVFHLAAQALVRPSYDAPLDTFDVNVMGTARVLEAARVLRNDVAIVVVTSDKCYENKDWVWGYRETDPLGGADPYSASKACAELVCGAYRQSFGGAIASARAGNVIGGGDWSVDRLVPDVMRALYAGDVPRVRNPSHVRTWQHVIEPISGYLLLAERLFSQRNSKDPDYASAWNFGPPPRDAMAVEDVVNRLLRLWGRQPWIHSGDRKGNEARTLRIDSAKANIELGWTARLTIDESLERVVEWHRADVRGRDVGVVMRGQIAEYEGRMRRE